VFTLRQKFDVERATIGKQGIAQRGIKYQSIKASELNTEEHSKAQVGVERLLS
jgi:hypothetical protein